MFNRNFQKYPAVMFLLFTLLLVLLSHLLTPDVTQILLSFMLIFTGFFSILSLSMLKVDKKYKKINYLAIILSICVGVFLVINFRNAEVHTELVSISETNKDDINGYGFVNDSISILLKSNKIILISKNNIGSVYECDINKLEIGDRLEVHQEYAYNIFGTRVNGFKHLKSSTSNTTVPMRYLRN